MTTEGTALSSRCSINLVVYCYSCSSMRAPVTLPNTPAGHGAHAAPATLYCPAAHRVVLEVAPPLQFLPAGHGSHAGDAPATLYRPGHRQHIRQCSRQGTATHETNVCACAGQWCCCLCGRKSYNAMVEVLSLLQMRLACACAGEWVVLVWENVLTEEVPGGHGNGDDDVAPIGQYVPAPGVQLPLHAVVINPVVPPYVFTGHRPEHIAVVAPVVVP